MPLFVRVVRITVPPDEAQDAVEGHLAQIAEFREQGRIRAAGEFPRGNGFLEIFEARDRLEAERIASESPLVAQGLGGWSLDEWREIEDG